ncbi:MAG: zinc ribbon domain-containing protein [Acidobacteriota bacterium]
MPQDCPQCSRPNGDAAVKCLYCGAALEPQAVQASDEDAPTESFPDTYAIVVTHDADAIAGDVFTSITSRPASWLTFGTPLTVQVFTDLEDAMTLHKDLGAAGIEATIVSDARLGEQGTMLVARRANVARGGIEFISTESHKATLLLKDLALAVRAHVADPGTVDDPNRLRARSISGRTYTPLSGGTTKVNVLDLHSRSGHPVRIVAERFDYAILGGSILPSAAANFESLIQMIRDHAPNVRYDTAFSKLDPADAHEEARRLELYGRRLLAGMLQG